VAPTLLGATGWIYGAVALALCAVFTALSVRVLTAGADVDRRARQMFGFSILYLFLLFALMALDRVPHLAAVAGT
jgi:protoheme IX farnesyltransferase